MRERGVRGPGGEQGGFRESAADKAGANSVGANELLWRPRPLGHARSQEAPTGSTPGRPGGSELERSGSLRALLKTALWDAGEGRGA